ncbi:MAG: PEP-CTERM sorting domain-containing protein [Vicinamibacterales bacterium]
MKSIFGILAVASMGLMANTGTAYAAPTFCVPGPNTDTLLVSDVTFRGNSADDCYGVLGDNNLTLSEVNALWNAKYGTGDYGFAIGDGDDVTIDGVKYGFEIGSGSSGTWDLNVSDPGVAGDFPQTLDILLVLNDDDVNPESWAFYLFNDETFIDTSDADGNTWSIGWTGVNSTPRLDSAFLLFRNGTPGTGSGSGSGQAAVPEPASLLLLGSGLGAAAWRARRKKQQ